MINYEFWIDIAIILLLIPTIFYTATLSAKLSKVEQNQNKMAELTQALRHATEVYALQSAPQSKNTVAKTTADTRNKETADISLYNEPYFNQNISTSLSQPVNEQQTLNSEPKSEKQEQPSEAELELLQALKSIK